MKVVLVVFDTLRKDCVGAYGSPPWGPVRTPNLDAFAREAVVFDRAYPESLPTLPARRALYTGQRVYPFENGDIRLKGDFVGAAGWGPIREDQDTLAELLSDAGVRTALVSDVYHMFKPSKNFWRGFDQWTFLRGQESDPSRSGPAPDLDEIRAMLPAEVADNPVFVKVARRFLLNMHDRRHEDEYFSARVLQESARWLEQNADADRFFIAVESFDPHEPWIVPDHYRRMYGGVAGDPGWVSRYAAMSDADENWVTHSRTNYSGLVTMCDRWFGHLMEALRVQGRLDDTLVIVTSDHGHSIGDRGYMGKRGYPSVPEVFDVPLMVRYPGAEHAGTRRDDIVQHTDITATILDACGVEPRRPLHGRSFLRSRPGRTHATVGWGAAATVITDRWWYNAKVDGTGVLLHPLDDAGGANVAASHPDVVDELFALAVADAGGAFPEWLLKLAASQADAPGCSDVAARA